MEELNRELLDKINALAEPYRAEVIDFIEFLTAKEERELNSDVDITGLPIVEQYRNKDGVMVFPAEEDADWGDYGCK